MLDTKEHDRAFLASRTGLLTITLEQGGEPKLERLLFEVSPSADFTDIARKLSADGVQSEIDIEILIGYAVLTGKKPQHQASKCEETSGVCGEWDPYDLLGELELWCAHHKVKQSAHGPVAGIRFPRFQILKESLALVVWNGGLEKARAEMSHKFDWLAAQFRRNDSSDVDWVAPRDVGERGTTAKSSNRQA